MYNISGLPTEPIVEQKVMINGIPGIVTDIFPPDESIGFSGRFKVDIFEKYRTYNAEFWWYDWCKSVIPVQK